jgi:hypothetical protein
VKEQEVSEVGILVAALLALVGTIGHYLTVHSSFAHDDEWFLIFAVAILTLCAAAVNFDPKRWLR